MTIIKYRPSDRLYMWKICRETAWDSYKTDPKKARSVCILYNDYFTEYEPENIFIAADDNDIPVGYIICSSDYDKFVKAYRGPIKKELAETAPLEFWQLYFFLYALKKIKRYSCHLHIDLLPEYQHMGLGTQLMDALVEHLRGRGIDHVSVCGISTDSDGYKFYKKYGFRKIHTYFKGIVSLTYDIK